MLNMNDSTTPNLDPLMSEPTDAGDTSNTTGKGSITSKEAGNKVKNMIQAQEKLMSSSSENTF